MPRNILLWHSTSAFALQWISTEGKEQGERLTCWKACFAHSKHWRAETLRPSLLLGSVIRATLVITVRWDFLWKNKVHSFVRVSWSKSTRRGNAACSGTGLDWQKISASPSPFWKLTLVCCHFDEIKQRAQGSGNKWRVTPSLPLFILMISEAIYSEEKEKSSINVLHGNIYYSLPHVEKKNPQQPAIPKWVIRKSHFQWTFGSHHNLPIENLLIYLSI